MTTMRYIGEWEPGSRRPSFAPADVARDVEAFRQPVHVLRRGADGPIGVAVGGEVSGLKKNGERRFPVLASLPGVYPEWLGDRSFCERHGVRFPYVAGAMANGIASPNLVVAMAKARMLAFYGAAGLGLDEIEAGLDEIERRLPADAVWGANLIHAPNEPALEMATAELFLERGVTRVSASAFMNLTRSVVRYAASGLKTAPGGRIVRTNAVFAKISRPEVARRFMSPAPASMLRDLTARGDITAREAELAGRVPVAEDITVEADSGGHTDNQPLGALFPTVRRVRDELVAEHGYERPIRVGAAGGIGTPSSVASAFGLGAAYVLTGSVNQAAVESGLSAGGKEMLARTGFGDVMMAPAADMFELGVELQVLKRGTMFAVRAKRLWELYDAYESIEEMPDDVREELESRTLGTTVAEIWEQTQAFFSKRDPSQLERAAIDPRHRMALIFRWYLGNSSRWAIEGAEDRVMDYQIWCGPAMAAFNAWAKGTFLEPPESRGVVQIALNLMEGAAAVTRGQQLRTWGVPVPPSGFSYEPRRLRLD